MPLRFPFSIDRTGRSAQPHDRAAYVRELIEAVLFTSPGERVNRPRLGTGVQQLVFEPGGEQIEAAAQHLVRGGLQQWLAEYIEVYDVTVVARDAEVEVTLAYSLRGEDEPRIETFVSGG